MKNLIVVAVVFLTVFSTSAQEKGDIEFGVNLGYNISNVTSENTSTSSKGGINIGASGEYFFSDRWGINFQLIYDQKGWADGFVIPEGSSDMIITDFRVSYLTIPLTANLHFGKSKGWHFNFGPYVGFLINAEVGHEDMDVKDAFATTDFGLALGIGYKFRLSEKTKLVLDYQSQSGFSNAFDENSTTTIRNGRSSFNLGLLFDL